MRQQTRDLFLIRIEQYRCEHGVEIFREREIEQKVERVLPAAAASLATLLPS